jgi:hypothetical protein
MFVLGLSALFAGGSWRRWMIPVVVVTIGLNGLLLFQYQLFLKGVRDIAPYPTGAYGLLLARFVVPIRFMAQWLGHS